MKDGTGDGGYTIPPVKTSNYEPDKPKHIAIGFKALDIEQLVTNAVVIGPGTQNMIYNSGEILIAAGPDENGNGTSIRLCPDGVILVNEKPITKDSDLVEAFRKHLYVALKCDHEDIVCTVCGVQTSRLKYPQFDTPPPFICCACREVLRKPGFG